ncbi:MAG: hypothetical protein E6K32_03660, partial [Gammaproteobacteria bacterium]
MIAQIRAALSEPQRLRQVAPVAAYIVGDRLRVGPGDVINDEEDASARFRCCLDVRKNMITSALPDRIRRYRLNEALRRGSVDSVVAHPTEVSGHDGGILRGKQFDRALPILPRQTRVAQIIRWQPANRRQNIHRQEFRAKAFQKPVLPVPVGFKVIRTAEPPL